MAQLNILKSNSPARGAIPDVELKKIYKMYGAATAVQGVDLEVQRGELFSILGPSGCGKTTLLRVVAGFEEPSAGDVLIQGQPMTFVPAYRRCGSKMSPRLKQTRELKMPCVKCG